MHETTDMTALHDLAFSYYRSMVAGDEGMLLRLFDPRAIIVGNYEGAFLWQDLQAFIDETKGLIGQHGKEECRVESLRIDGDIGTVAVRGRYMGMWFLDHLSAVRVGGDWKIVGKTFHVEGAAVPAP
jgi:Putative lumazine-binding